MLELLNQLDGFDTRGDVKVIMATNKIESLDPALIRPGRIDRKIEFPLPSRRERRLIFQTCTAQMNLGPDVDLEDCTLISQQSSSYSPQAPSDVSRPDRLSSAEIASIVQAAGLQGERSHHQTISSSADDPSRS